MDSVRVCYLQQLCDKNLGRNVYKSPWGGVLLKKCDPNGELYSFKTIKEYKETSHHLWLYLEQVVKGGVEVYVQSSFFSRISMFFYIPEEQS